MDDSDRIIGRVSGAQAVNSPVVKSLPRGLRDRSRRLVTNFRQRRKRL